MSAKWVYKDGNVAFAYGTGTYDRGWYAAAPSTAERGDSPEKGPYSLRRTALAAAETLRRDEEGRKASWKPVPDGTVRVIWACPVCHAEYDSDPDQATIPFCMEDGCNECETEFARSEVLCREIKL